MEFSARLGSIGLCVGAIVAAAVIYFAVTAIKGKKAERKEREALTRHKDQQDHFIKKLCRGQQQIVHRISFPGTRTRYQDA